MKPGTKIDMGPYGPAVLLEPIHGGWGWRVRLLEYREIGPMDPPQLPGSTSAVQQSIIDSSPVLEEPDGE